MSSLFIAKIVSATVIVLGLSIVTERISPRVAGVLAGLPLGAAIVIFFIGIEQGPEFGGETSLSMVLGLTASLVFLYSYWFCSSRLFRSNRYSRLVMCSLLSIAVFLFTSWLLSGVPQNVGLMTAITVATCLLCIRLFRKIPNVKVEQRVRLTLPVLAVRALIAVAIVALITGVAAYVGPRWSGLLAGFPITLYPLLLIVHRTYSAEQVGSIIKNFPFGMGSLVIYGLLVSYLYPAMGVISGTTVAMVAAISYLVAIAALGMRKAR
ncbi:MAG: hypothetical protein AAF402_14195 [Pseudomonadota bacterium]